MQRTLHSHFVEMGSKSRIRYPHKYTPAAGIKDDFEELLQRFIATETVRYENFVEIWRDMKMPLIFAGRQTEREVREFIEECFRIASQYVLAPYNFQVRVGALYLLYGLYNLQPLLHRVKIRTTHTMWLDLLEFQSEAQRQQHLDVDFVFQKLRFQNAFLFTAKQVEVLTTADKTKDEVSLSEEFKEEQSVLFDLFSTEMLEQMATVHQHYEAVKVALEGPQATHPSRSLSVIKQDLVPGITKAIIYYQDRRKAGALKKKATHNVGDDLSSDSMEEDNEEETKPSKKLLLKEKAFAKAAIPSRRYRRGKVSASSGSERDESKPPEPVSDVPVTVREMSDEDPDDKDSEQVTALKQSLMNMPYIPTETVDPPKRGRRKKGQGTTRKKGKSAKMVVNPLPAYSSKVKEGASPAKKGRGRPRKK